MLSKTALISREGARQKVRYVSTMGSQTTKSRSADADRLFSCPPLTSDLKEITSYPNFSPALNLPENSRISQPNTLDVFGCTPSLLIDILGGAKAKSSALSFWKELER